MRLRPNDRYRYLRTAVRLIGQNWRREPDQTSAIYFGRSSGAHRYPQKRLSLDSQQPAWNDGLWSAKQTRLCARYSTPEHSHPSKRLYIILRALFDRSCETEME